MKQKSRKKGNEKMYKCKTKNNCHENGITLVALIITIIVLVILAAVSVAAVYNSKIVNYAVNGSIDYTQAAVNENQILKGSVDIIESGIGKIQEIVGDNANKPVTSTPDPIQPDPPTPPVQGKPIDELAVGAYVSYVPNGAATYPVDKAKATDDNADQDPLQRHTSTASNNADWRIWDKPDSTHIRLISTKASTTTLRLQGANGYNNAVGLLNDACSTMYKNTDMGATAQSIDMDDIDAKKGSAAKKDSTTTNTKPTPSKSPKIYDYERNGTVNRSWQGTNNSALDWYSSISTTSYTPTWTYYYYTLADLPNTAASPYYALLSQQTESTGANNPSYYWIASRCVWFSSARAGFYVFYVAGGFTYTHLLYNSSGGADYNSLAVRPLVTLDLNSCAVGATGSGTEASPYDIVKK